jgi:formylglycine-generating enzyme required for sulfatase activity
MIDRDALYTRPVAERHRLIFYLGHLEAFDWNQMCCNGLAAESFHAGFDKLFEFGIDPEPGQLPQDQPRDWPSVAEVIAYNQQARQRVDRLLAEVPEILAGVAIEHRLMHAETLAYLLHNLPPSRKKSPVAINYLTAGDTPENPMVEIGPGRVTLGQSKDAGFGWDNEFEQHTVEVGPFRISRYKVTNGEYLRFVQDGGSPPHFWRSRSGRWFWRAMFDEVPLPLDWPVYVTWEQASSYAAWLGWRLPSEAQYHRAAFGRPDNSGENRFPWGNREPEATSGNFDFRSWDPVPVWHAPDTDSAFGVSQLSGNGWEWCRCAFGPFPGFEPFSFYPGYSANFFDGRHYVLKGASPRTDAVFLRRSFRNWFRPNYPHVYATFHLVED